LGTGLLHVDVPELLEQLALAIGDTCRFARLAGGMRRVPLSHQLQEPLHELGLTLRRNLLLLVPVVAEEADPRVRLPLVDQTPAGDANADPVERPALVPGDREASASTNR